MSFIISLIAGLSTIIGALLIFFKPKNINKFIGFSLSFSGSMMIFISLFELIPDGFYYLIYNYSITKAIILLSLMFILGSILITFINKIIVKRVGESSNSNLYKVGILSMIALMLHNMPEGILTFLSTTVDIKLGVKLALTISLHNIPEGISIAVPLYYSTRSKIKALSYTLWSGLAEPLGAFLAYILLYKFINKTMISLILIFVAGIMISISINEIFEESKKYSYKSIIYGFIIALILTIITSLFL